MTVFMLVEPFTRGLVQSFASGQSGLSQVPLLCRMAGRFLFALTTERWVESLHALAKHTIVNAHRIGPVHVAFHAMFRSIRKLILQRDTTILEQLASHCRECRNARLCIEAVGLGRHPDIELLAQQGNNRIGFLNRACRPDMVQLLYHVDARTLHRDLPDPPVLWRWRRW
jgi:hypothetical protein